MNRNINGLLKAQLLIGLTFVWGGILVIAITGKGLIASLLVFVGALILNVVVIRLKRERKRVCSGFG